MTEGTGSAREMAVRALLRVEQGAYSNLTMDGAREALGIQDAGLASAIFYTTLERRLTLDHILKHYSKKPLDTLSPEVLACLRIGLCQLLYLDGVNDYAAVHETVETVKGLGQGKASGYVNGILRAFLRDEKRIPGVRGGRGDRLSVTYSCPRWLVKRLLQVYGEGDTCAFLEASLGRPPVYLRANPLLTTPEGLIRRLEAEGLFPAADSDVSGCIRVDTLAPERLESFREGWYHVQDKSSQACALALDAQPGQRVLDVCAAPGGKSFTVAGALNNQGEVWSLDLHENRVSLIADGAKRLGFSCIRTGIGDAQVFSGERGLFDRVLCDVPCSGFGILRRKPEIKYKTPQSVKNLPELQYKILKTSAQYLKSRGRLVYSTCTLLPEENGGVARRFLTEAPEFHVLREETRLGTDGGDGFYFMVMEKA